MSVTGEVTRANVSGHVDIPFPQYQVEHVHQLRLQIPDAHPAVGTLHVWVTDQTGTVVARNFINFEHFVALPQPIESDDSGTIRLNWTPENISRSSWDEPTRSDHLFSAVGSGYVEYEISLTEGLSTADVAEIELVFEASSAYGGARQTEPKKHPSDVTISVNSTEIETVRIPDCPADARGALSYINRHPGIYGYLPQCQGRPIKRSEHRDTNNPL